MSPWEDDKIRELEHVTFLRRGRQPEVNCFPFFTSLYSTIRNENTWSDDLKRYVWRFEATKIIKMHLK